ncbi:hypothetical protein A5866_001314 [Enterococcus sp. 12C11_DIV0727]|uniref:Uncharacterized protein n=2 Tax=Candidatus Enterococcus lemimoniae TaxID=1834167 RepID=A0ABZ2T4D5_9ENTE|nr:ribonuclease domain-containing protein [Enterococcus sp. 12C11_DIV0727]OTO68510.1 guanine-specific ribonuclease N1 and T1 [Enterococcus sp. 12C11_DIV0727]
MGMIFQAAINNMDAGITRNQAKKAKIEEKLRKFLAFCDKSPSYFDGLKSSEELMTKGMQALGVDGSGNVGAGSWNGKGFSLKDTAWIKDVNKNWNDRVERRDKQLLDGCKIIRVFDDRFGTDSYMIEKNGYRYALNEDDLSADLKKLIKKYGLDVLELSPTEMTKRVNDFQKSGRDYFSGDKVGMPGFGALAHGQDFMGKMQESGLWDAMWALGLTGAAVRNAQIYDKKVSGANGTGNGANSPKNVALHEKYKDVLGTTEKANPLVDSLRETGRLPDNFVSKDLAIEKGWRPGKALENYVSGGQIGGDVYQNSTKILPEVPGRVWREADVGLIGDMSRAKQPGTRLLYSNDGLLYITTDHYKTMHFIGNY